MMEIWELDLSCSPDPEDLHQHLPHLRQRNVESLIGMSDRNH